MFEAGNIEFVCPMCKTSTRQTLLDGEKKGIYTKIESTTKKNFFVFIKKELEQKGSGSKNH